MEQEMEGRWKAALAETLRAERGVAGLSQAAVERLARISRTSYRLYEEGERQPNAVQLAAITEALGVPWLRFMAEVQRRATE